MILSFLNCSSFPVLFFLQNVGFSVDACSWDSHVGRLFLSPKHTNARNSINFAETMFLEIDYIYSLLISCILCHVWQDKQGSMGMHPSMESCQGLTRRDPRILGFHHFHLRDHGKPYSVDHLITFHPSPNFVWLSLNPYWKREQLLLSECKRVFS